MTRFMTAVCLSVSLFAVTGCRRHFSFETTGVRVTILTEPSGAKVYQKLPPPGSAPRLIGETPLNGVVVPIVRTMKGSGLSPAAAQDMARQAGNLVVEIRKEGYKLHSTILAVDQEKTLEHRIVLEPEPTK